MFFQKSIREVTLEDLKHLVESGTAENLYLDYKKLPDIGKDKGKRELAKDVTAFANTNGGTLLYGVVEDEEDGSAIIEGIECSDVDGLKLHISSIIQGNTDPMLVRYEIEAIQVEEGKYVIGIDVPKSWNAPHAVRVKKGTYRFYIRVNTENVPMDVSQIRDQMIVNQSLAEKIRGFVTERLMSLAINDTPIPLDHTTKLVLHLVPVDAFTQNKHVQLINDFEPLMCLGLPSSGKRYNYRYNLDGVLTYHKSFGSYTQLYRNGIVEAVTTYYLGHTEKIISSYILLDMLERKLGNYLSLYKKMNIECPIYGFISFQGVKGFLIKDEEFVIIDEEIGYVGPDPNVNPRPFERDAFQLPEMIIEDLDTDPKELLRFPMDVLWNASGMERCFELDYLDQWREISDQM